MDKPLKILVKYATRGRVKNFFEGMESIYNLAANPDNIRVLITADEDDIEMNTQAVRAEIAFYKNAHVIYGVSENKIHACNRDFDIMPEEWKDWDIVANFSDDMRWTGYGWDEFIRTDFKLVYPDLDGYMAYLDPDTHGALSTLYIAGRKFFDKFNFIYDPQFVSLFCDNLVEDVAKRMGKYHYTAYSIYQHFNPAYYSHIEKDSQFLEQQLVGWDVDRKQYDKIIANGIDNYLTSFI